MHEVTHGAWEVDESRYPTAGSIDEQLGFLIEYAVLAPSIYNTQPWRFEIQSGAIELYADRSRALPVADPAGRELIISCGAALFFLRLAAQRFGLRAALTLLPATGAPAPLARLQVTAAGAAESERPALFRALTRRHTSRRLFAPRPLPPELLAALSGDAAREGAWLRFARDAAERAALTALVEEGDRLQGADERFRRELAAWIRPADAESREGIPSAALGLRDLAIDGDRLLTQTIDRGEVQAERDRQLLESASALAVLGTGGDSARDWLLAGQALGRVLLAAAAEGLSASFFNQPIELTPLRARLHARLGGAGYPQLLFRLGYAPESRPTPRRPAGEVTRRERPGGAPTDPGSSPARAAAPAP